MILRRNQIDAINKSIENDFSSGIHYHATGTGKSWIAMFILEKFNKKYPKSNVLWICERKDILTHQFSKSVIKDRGFDKILKNFNVLDFVNNKNGEWYESLNSSIFWGKPFLCIINRCFLTSKNKYEAIKSAIGLIIHDECHSIQNCTTQIFYKWFTEKHCSKFNIKNRIIGFSATPEKMSPLDTIISKYSIYDGYLDKVILPPKIVWLKSEKEPSMRDLVYLVKTEINKLPYKKIIVWCGMIEECIKLLGEWQKYFPNYKFCIDFNNIDTKYKYLKNKDIRDFNYFYNLEENGILFCAVKHREGSDIPNIDGCIFMDKVSQRGERVFIQCMGRVLRTDPLNKKKYGLIIDLKAKSTIDICNRVQHYLKLKNIFPWKFSISKKRIESNAYYLNYLDMIDGAINNIEEEDSSNTIYTKDDIKSYFKRKIPNIPEYIDRVEYELDLIIEKKLFGDILKALEILKITKNIPHITRGSCGSSLVCYLLGISHVDPVRYKICFSRFLNRYRDTLPDIDFDFPHYLRDEVFLKLFQKWGDKVARISNHNYYHEKSALRESLRMNGINKFISKYDINREVKSYSGELQERIHKTQKEIEGTFKNFSLHCGGIIYYPDGIPEEHLLDKNKTSIIPQVSLNKIDVSNNKNFKIDILSSCGLTQLYYCHSFSKINFNEYIGDEKSIQLLSSGDNIGLTFAETPLIRKAFILIKPRTIMDVAICLSIVRPAAKDAKRDFENSNYCNNNIIFDDDAITFLSKIVGCDEEIADKLRRGLPKSKKSCMEIIDRFINKNDKKSRNKIEKIITNLRKYSFCKAHALSYAQLVWQLAYQKAHNPKKFWESTLKNVKSSYKKWVHLYEAKCNGVTLNLKRKNLSIYAVNRNKGIYNEDNHFAQLKKYGYWLMDNNDFYKDCYYFEDDGKYFYRGLIASSKIKKYGNIRKLELFVGVEKSKYICITITGNFYFDSKKVIVKGFGKMKNRLYGIIESYSNNIELL